MVNPSALLAALDIVAFEAVGGDAYRSVGPIPPELVARFGALRHDSVELGQVFPFLAAWLDELVDGVAPESSGTWSQADDVGVDCQLDATAVWPDGRRIVMIEFAGPDSRRVQAILQAAREQRLAQERLEKAQAALQRARDQLEVRVADRTAELLDANRRLLLYQSQLRSLVDQLGVAEERERRRIATYLHDHVGQSLAVAKMRLGALASEHGAAENSEFEDLSAILDSAIAETRTLTFDLASPVLYELGLESALENLAKRFGREHGISVECKVDRADKPMGVDTSALLFQSTRELLHNIVKHAAPSRVSITCRRRGEMVEICVVDDGSGFDVARAVRGPSAEGGFGLFNIRERLDLIGGRIAIESSPGQGARISLHAPLSLDDEPDTDAHAPDPPRYGQDSPR